MTKENAKNPELFVDNNPYNWTKSTISGAELRTLATVPEGVDIFQKVPGQKDKEILADTEVSLTGKGPERFSTQAAGSDAG